MLLAEITGSAIAMLFIWIVVIALICWLAWWLIAYCQLPEPFNKILRVLVAFVAVIFLINAILTLVDKPFIRW